MKVKELIRLLENYDEEMEVVVLHPSHNYWKNYHVDNCFDIREAVLTLGNMAPEDWQQKMRCDFEDGCCMDCVVIS